MKRGVGNPTWVRDKEEVKLIKKYADQWCKGNDYPIQKQRYVYKGKMEKKNEKEN